MSDDFHTNGDELAYLDIRESNRRHDSQLHSITMDPGVPLRARQLTNVVGRRLTDKVIDRYVKRGFYSQAYKDARRELMQRKAAKRQAREAKRDGNFLIFNDGRKVYAPA